MPLKHLRICQPCNQIRFQACSPVCHAPDAQQKDSWVENLQQGAGTTTEATR